MILAKLPKLAASPCSAPWWIVPAGKENGHKKWYMRQLPIANNITGIYSKIILLETNKTKLIPKIMLPIITTFIHNEHNIGQMSAKSV